MKYRIIMLLTTLFVTAQSFKAKSASFLEEGKTWWYYVTSFSGPATNYSPAQKKGQIGFILQGTRMIEGEEWSCLKVIDSRRVVTDEPLYFLKEKDGRIFTKSNLKEFRDKFSINESPYDILVYYSILNAFKSPSAPRPDEPLYDFNLSEGTMWDFQESSRRVLTEIATEQNSNIEYRVFDFETGTPFNDIIKVYENIGVASGRIGFFFAPFWQTELYETGNRRNLPVLTYVTDSAGNIIYSNKVYSKYFPNPLELKAP